MKRIYFLLALLVSIGSIVNAQYYYLPYPSAGQNPGGLNTDTEYPVGGGQPAGWTSIHAGSAATPQWSTTATIPFAFDFNGSAVTSYKVSTSGVLTFTTSAATAPAVANTAIPSASIPDNSVCVWGITGSGTNDNICYKTFGTAPNRQHWIIFSSYTDPGNAAYTYFAIVLEETTNYIYVVDQRNGGTALSLTIGIQINSTTAVSVVGSPNVTQLAGADPTPADNGYYKFMQGTQSAIEAELTSLDVQPYVVAPSTVSIGGTITNYGTSPINSITIKYENSGNVYTDTKTGLNITFTQAYNFTHNTIFNVPTVGNYDVKVWVELAGDGFHANDTLITTVHGLSFFPTKRVVFEEATGTWCGWCPRGAVFMDSLKTLYPTTAELVAVHNSDPMVVAAYDAGIGAMIGGYPSGLVDRKDNDVDPSTFIAEYQQRILDVPPCDITVTANFNAVTRVIDATVSGHFATDLSGDFRFNAIVVEEDVTGTGSTWNQTNYYSSTSQNLPLQGAGHNWQTEPNPVPAANMVYDHVARAILGGFNGQAGSAPVSIPVNSTQSYTFSYTLPVGYDETQVHVVGWLSDFSTGNILNANHGSLTTGINNVIASENFSIKILGNPSSNSRMLLNLKKSSTVKLEIIDALGQIISSNETLNLSSGEYVYDLKLAGHAQGIYTVRVTAGNEALIKRFVIAD